MFSFQKHPVVQFFFLNEKDNSDLMDAKKPLPDLPVPYQTFLFYSLTQSNKNFLFVNNLEN